jgi:AcrR family transcriptional regulator
MKEDNDLMRAGTKSSPRRGRPPSYDRDAALRAIRDVFWDRGFVAASLDDIAAAAGMNRPSLYGAFGDKREMYLAVLRMFSAESGRAMQKALEAPTLGAALEAFYGGAIQEYVSGKAGPHGCLIICTAVVEATGDATIRSALAEMLAEIDSLVAVRIARAQAEGDRCAAGDAKTLARLATSVLHSVAVRARAGVRRSELLTIARATIELLVGPASGAAPARRARLAR